MAKRPPVFNAGPARSKQQRRRDHDAARRDLRTSRAWYGSARWRKRRLDHLASEPLCRFCLKLGIVNDGSRRNDGTFQADPRRRFLVADHIEPHGDDPVKFWTGELQTLCPDDHDRVKQAEEARLRAAARRAREL